MVHNGIVNYTGLALFLHLLYNFATSAMHEAIQTAHQHSAEGD